MNLLGADFKIGNHRSAPAKITGSLALILALFLIVDLDGSRDRVLYSAPLARTKSLRDLHVFWPDWVNGWFLVSFFPFGQNLPSSYAPPLDDILLVNTNGSHKVLARTGTAIAAHQKDLWRQPLASPSSDKSRVSFNSNRGGSINQYILWVPPEVARGALLRSVSP
jgi:hypothetical protein